MVYGIGRSPYLVTSRTGDLPHERGGYNSFYCLCSQQNRSGLVMARVEPPRKKVRNPLIFLSISIFQDSNLQAGRRPSVRLGYSSRVCSPPNYSLKYQNLDMVNSMSSHCLPMLVYKHLDAC